MIFLGGVHAAGDDDDAREARLLAELHVLHVEEHEAELAEYIGQMLDWSAFYRPNVFVNTPDILHEYLQLGGPRRSRRGSCSRRRWSPTYGIYSGFESCENVPVRDGVGGVPRLGEVRGEEARARWAAAAARGGAERGRAVRSPRCSASTNFAWLETENDAARRVRQRGGNVVMRRQHRPVHRRRRVSCVVPARSDPPAFDGRRPADRRASTAGGLGPQLRPTRAPAQAHVRGGRRREPPPPSSSTPIAQ